MTEENKTLQEKLDELEEQKKILEQEKEDDERQKKDAESMAWAKKVIESRKKQQSIIRAKKQRLATRGVSYGRRSALRRLNAKKEE